MQKNLILIDDHKMIIYGLKCYIQHHSAWSVLFTAASKTELLQNLSEYKESFFSESEEVQNIALIDIKVGDSDGYELCRLVKEQIPGIHCIMYSMYSTYGNIMYAFESGAEGFLSKEADENELILALDAVSSGKVYIQQDLMKTVLVNSNKMSLLTRREKQIFDLLINNEEKKAICQELKITIHTLENYLSILYSKLEVQDMEELKKKYGGKV